MRMLPVGPPKVSAFLHHAYQLSILEHVEKAKPWIYMNFIHLLGDEKGAPHPVQFRMPDLSGYNWSVLTPFFDHQILQRDFLLRNRHDFTDIAAQAILEGQYVYAYVNEKYLPGTAAHHQGMDANHPLLILGYDGPNDRFAVLGFNKQLQLNVMHADRAQLRSAYYDNEYDFPRQECTAILFKIREDEAFELEVTPRMLLNELKLFYASANPATNVWDYHKGYSFRYGLDVYDTLLVLLEHQETWEQVQSLVVFHLLMEHKALMADRLRYMQTLNPAIRPEPFIVHYDSLARDFGVLRNQVLKSQLTDVPVQRSLLSRRIESIKAEEKRLLADSIDCLERSV